MFFLFFNLNFLEYAELYCFPKELTENDAQTTDLFMAYTLTSHCKGAMGTDPETYFLNPGNDHSSGVLGKILSDSDGGGTTVVKTYFESTDRMQLTILQAPSTKVISVRATVFMDILLFRRNMQLELVSAEEQCAGCLVHKGYSQNFAALAPYFEGATGDIASGSDYKVVGASAGGVMALLGAIQMENELNMLPTLVQTTGMPRPGNKALSKFVMDEFGANSVLSYIYYRDPMPHIPPTFLGYRQATKSYTWMYRTNGADLGTTKIRTAGTKEAQKTPMDVYIANKIWFFRVMDHTMYFATKDLLTTSRSVDDALNACGQYTDELLVEYHTSDLFNF